MAHKDDCLAGAHLYRGSQRRPGSLQTWWDPIAALRSPTTSMSPCHRYSGPPRERVAHAPRQLGEFSGARNASSSDCSLRPGDQTSADALVGLGATREQTWASHSGLPAHELGSSAFLVGAVPRYVRSICVELNCPHCGAAGLLRLGVYVHSASSGPSTLKADFSAIREGSNQVENIARGVFRQVTRRVSRGGWASSAAPRSRRESSGLLPGVSEKAPQQLA